MSRNGELFSDIGDADPSNVNRKIAPHIIRMASTRAKARVLRDLCNIGITCLEEASYNADDWYTSSEGVRSVLSEFIAYTYAKLFFHP